MNAVSSTASILHLVHQGFHSILRARGFEDEFGVYQLQLQVHLSRCASIMNNANRPANPTHSPEIAFQDPEATISETLSRIQETLRKAQREAARIRADLMAAAGGDLEASSATNTPLNLKKMRLRTAEFLDKQKIQTAKKVEALKWAFYKKDNCDKFIAEISSLIEHLERQVDVHRDARILLFASPRHLHETAHEAAHDST
ncbi:hypothetical protein BBK36DRAFT_1109606 [Trichoderma citrinoviride]|uniref:Prion-inhibition and propagation HeLo domain-containing protein n=1 Tax=Trichoderma citrinoviride TaxID=58853 RepID=A0A2T4BKY1_9HYPO|nr:hypothetical protein BBK36DRAFT_1109606 [Trichoderma citrinoviride]PTB69929.1 hypothetical protein BBK36DRAFT_1109606 [Trichoderma citrinoviride]